VTRRDVLKLSLAAVAAHDVGRADEWEGDLSVRMMDGAHRFIERKIAEAAVARAKTTPDRERFRKITGVVDPRVPVTLERVAQIDQQDAVWETWSIGCFPCDGRCSMG
jgi:hypothetical protein